MRHVRISRGIVETILRNSSLTNLHFVAGGLASEDEVVHNGRATIIWNLPGQMRAGGIARAGEAWRFRRQRGSDVGVTIMAGEQSLSTALASHSHIGNEIIRGCAGNATCSYAAVAVAVQNAAFVIDGYFIEVEKIAICRSATLLPDAGHALHGIVRRGVNGRPRLAAVIGGSDESVPFAWKAVGLVVAVHVG